MAEIIESVHPTRMELLEIRNKIKLATKGHKLLKEKRDSLIMEFFKIVEEARGERTKLFDKLSEGYKDLIFAKALMSSEAVDSIAYSMPERGSIEIKKFNVFGVEIPRIDLIESKASREYSLLHTSSKLDEAVSVFSEIYIDLIKLVESEESMRKIGDEIKKTKRRVNALEYILIPRLTNTQKYIRNRLEELERENFFRLKRVKSKKFQK